MPPPTQLSRRTSAQLVSDGVEIAQAPAFEGDGKDKPARIMLTKEAASNLIPILQKLVNGSGRTKSRSPK